MKEKSREENNRKLAKEKRGGGINLLFQNDVDQHFLLLVLHFNRRRITHLRYTYHSIRRLLHRPSFIRHTQLKTIPSCFPQQKGTSSIATFR